MPMRSLLHSAFTSKLYVTVLVAIALGAALGLIAPEIGASLEPVGTGFISLIQMLIAPVVFCTIVTGIASAGELTAVGRVGVKALVYFEVVTTIALIAGLVVMDVFEPGRGLNADPNALQLSGAAEKYLQTSESQNWYDFLVQIIPHSVVSAFTEGNVLQVLLIAILFALAIKALGSRGEPLARGIGRVGEAVFGVVKLVMYLAPLGAFGAMAYTTGKFGLGTLTSLGSVIALFWATGIVFSLLVFGLIARLCGLRILKLYRYFKDELLITLGTSNYEVVMPQLMRKLENLGSPKRIVGLVVPSGYAFNGDGVCLYLGFASLYIAQAFNVDLSLWQQIGLLAVFMVTSKGSAGVAGAGFVILAATLSTTGAVPVVGIMLVLGIDRFLSTMRGLVSLSGQIMGSLVVARWERALDLERARAVLNGEPVVPLPDRDGSAETFPAPTADAVANTAGPS
ncbi:aerobic C4-dicarboxylate transport protein [Saccharopolyspora erythraea NRRL 2338]|uniref:C4-dicarboxylate transport protein n=2 Tax=Saccharopolyspora erythraea TaxID=1836 RepID=A4FJT6_SACEN|nr:C4-dicarboxylate transporter DctA [Saccharopolyspora erythraea]EQD83367.1 C4-dicarboxylate ABC transporter [Saccharopolyspora erythraea D]PFG97954.1 aerobic C4-dicarboxylate transport protein [Saccharopolyspora erythraea NRRL 2338]QRK88082.1 C4-dicarboxylate transporter DctA [Saccharopolyspora erythraea]CAM04311.1 C4-dicarboxylate transport protein [Saccharopolyspora erythraea NRRL 2338]